MGRPSYSPPPRKQRLFAYSWQCKVDIFTSQGGERMGRPVFLHPDNHLHMAHALSCQGGERMGWPFFPSPPKKQRLFAYSWQGKVELSLVGAGKEWAGPVFLQPDNLASKQDWYLH